MLKSIDPMYYPNMSASLKYADFIYNSWQIITKNRDKISIVEKLITNDIDVYIH